MGGSSEFRSPIMDSRGEFSNRMNPSELENLPYTDLTTIFDINKNAYHGPTNFNIWRKVNNKGIFPFSDQVALSESDHFEKKSDYGADIKWDTRYPHGVNPISDDITSFVDSHPYPHLQNCSETNEEYWEGIKRYQDRTIEEMRFHLNNSIYLASQNPELGEPIFTLAFNGAKPMGHLLTTELGIDDSNLMTSQIKRIPTTDGGLIIAAGGIKLPKAIHENRPVFAVMPDDCLATWATQKLTLEILDLVGAKVNGRFFTAVVGTRHPIREELNHSKIPTFVSLSSDCNDLASNGYLLTPDGKLMVGDMGQILNMCPQNSNLPHFAWGQNTPAHCQYQ
jgi:hypothetical protein